MRGAVVVVDCLTNEVRGSWRRKALSPDELVERVHGLRCRLLMAGAEAVVICYLKPMEVRDVRPYNVTLHEYLRAMGPTGFGCQTQVRIRDLDPRDGFHVLPQVKTVLDRTYAFAIMGLPVPCPTEEEDFIPTLVRRSYEAQWPRVGVDQRRGVGAQFANHGW